MSELPWAKIKWQGEIPFSIHGQDVYFSSAGGIPETEHVFIRGNHLHERWESGSDFRIGELGFGTGTTFLTTWKHWLKRAKPRSKLQYLSLEKHPVEPGDIRKVSDQDATLEPLRKRLLEQYPHNVEGIHRRTFLERDGKILVLTLVFGEALTWIKKLVAPRNGFADAWFLHGFAPDQNPDLWSRDLFQEMGLISRASCTLSTFSVAAGVREALTQAGWKTEKIPGFAQKKEMLVGDLYSHSSKISHAPWFARAPHQLVDSPIQVIGAGIAGSAVAHRLAIRGHLVEVIDQEQSFAQGASGNPTGMFMPFLAPEPDPKCRLQLSAVQFLKSVLKENSIPWKKGVLEIPESDKDETRIRRAINQMSLPRSISRLAAREEFLELLGIPLQNPPQAGVYHDCAGTLEPRELCRALLDHPNIRLSFNKVPLASSKTTIFCHAGQALKTPETQFLPLRPVRGQIVSMPENSQSQALKISLSSDFSWSVPFRGTHLLGATYQKGAENLELSVQDQAELLDRFHRQFPHLYRGELPLQGRAAIRFYPPDAIPFCGALIQPELFKSQFKEIKRGFPSSHFKDVQYHPGFYCLLGLGSRGLSTGVLGAEILASLLCDEILPVEEDLYFALHPARYEIRSLRA